jgi:hypothetical protein
MAFQLVNDASLLNIVQNLAQMVGYSTPADPAGGSDPAVTQMVQAVNVAGNDMLAMNDWQELSKIHSISIVADSPGQTEKGFALPEDFFEFTDQTQWNTSNQWPAIGPISPQMWQMLLVRSTIPTMSFYWQIRDSKIYILAPPSTAQTLTFFYQSLAWVRDADDANLYKNRATKNGDTILVDPYLMTLLARVKWLEMKGLDSAAAMRDFLVTFENRKGAEKGAPVLTMARDMRFPYLNPIQNTPDTNIGF